MSRSDSASFNINFNLPPEVIREYFNGLAKVEKAKHGQSSGFDWGVLTPFLVGAISALGPKSVRTPVPVSRECASDEEEDESSKTLIKINMGEFGEMITDVLGKMQTDDSKRKSTESSSHVDSSKDEKSGDSPKSDVSHDPKSDTSDSPKSTSNDSSKSDDSSKVDLKQDASSVKRPVYDEDHSQTPGFGPMGGFGADASGAGGLADMMKMFGPLMGQLMNGMQPGMQSGMNMPPGVKVEINPGSTQKSETEETPVPKENSEITEEKADVVD
jgi:hypothetical protein